MRTAVIKTEKPFQPVKIEIVIESLDEFKKTYDELKHLSNSKVAQELFARMVDVKIDREMK